MKGFVLCLFLIFSESSLAVSKFNFVQRRAYVHLERGNGSDLVL